MTDILKDYCESKKSYVMAQMLNARRSYERTSPSGRHEAKIAEMTIDTLEGSWKNFDTRLHLIPGKEALSALSKYAQDTYEVTVTAMGIIDAMRADEVPQEMTALVNMLAQFAATRLTT